VVDHWLWHARKRVNNSMGWDSGYTSGEQDDPPNVTALRDRPTIDKGRLESRFRHGLAYSGMAPIVRGNDPFWNVRVFETGMRDHDGYTSYPLMCAIQQLVMDRIAEDPTPAVAPPAAAPPAATAPPADTTLATTPVVPAGVERPEKAP
jgi:hypothetical protein